VSRKTVRWNNASEEFDVGGEPAFWMAVDIAEFIGAVDSVRDASLTELTHAARRYWATQYERDLTFRVYEAPEDLLREDEENFSPSAVEIEVSDDHFILSVTLAADLEIRVNGQELSQILAPLLERHHATFLQVTEYDVPLAKILTLSVELKSVRGRTFGDALAVGDSMLGLWEASLGGMLTPETVADLIRAQRPELLVGQPESQWLEVKGKPYDLKADLEALELAKDVSAFANGPAGGLLVIGFSTRKVGGRDHLRAVVAQPIRSIDPRKYRQALERLVLPPVEGLTIEAVEVEEEKGLLVIEIPPQSPALQPFLVIGAVSEGKVLGSHFAIYVRRGEDAEPVSPSVIHGQLLAGRLALDSFGQEAAAVGGRSPASQP
jgi:hypothetical protein